MANQISSRLLVIDISVGVWAGGSTEPREASKPAREFLQAVLKICHRMAWTPEIKAEWQAHKTPFTQTWLVSMFARRKVVSLKGQPAPALLTGICARAKDVKAEAALRKDFLLVQAALAAEFRVISADKIVRGLLHLCATEIQELRRIVWVNPNLPEEKACEWLSAGAEMDAHRFLGFTEPARKSKPR